MEAKVRLLALLCIPFFLYASSFTQAIKNYETATFKYQNQKAIRLANGILIFSEKPLKKEAFTKSSIQLGLYFLKKSIKKPSIKVLSRYPKNLIAIQDHNSMQTKITQESYGLQSLAQLSKRVALKSLLFGSCGTLRGINTSKGVLTSDLINLFLYKEPRYSSVGAVFKKTQKGIEVVAVNPFFAYGGFKVGDVVLAHQGRRYDIKRLLDTIIRYKVGTKSLFTINRLGKKEHIAVVTKPLLGGGVLAYTFLEHYGFRFDKELKIVERSKDALAPLKGLINGDRLISINGIVVKNEAEIQSYLSHFKPHLGKISLLFERNGLQFFIHIPANRMLHL